MTVTGAAAVSAMLISQIPLAGASGLDSAARSDRETATVVPSGDSAEMPSMDREVWLKYGTWVVKTLVRSRTNSASPSVGETRKMPMVNW